MNKLSHLESQRIMTLLEETFIKLHLSSIITRDTGSIPMDVIELLDDNLQCAIKLQKSLEDQLTELVSLRKLDTPEASENASKLQISTLNLCRILIQTPNMTDKIKAYQLGTGIRSQPLKAFLKNFADLRDLTYTRLTTTVEEEKSKDDFLSDIQAKELKSSTDLKNLQLQLGELRSRHEKDVASKNAIINKLKDEIQELKVNSVNELKRLEQETNSIEGRDLREHQDRDNGFSEEKNKLDQSLEDRVKTNKKAEHNLRKKKLKTEAEVEKWIKKYDTEMEEKETKIETLTLEYEQIKKELAELEEQYSKLCKERDEILAEERKIQDEQMTEQEKIRQLHHAAAVIQRWWREKLRKFQSERKIMSRRKSARKDPARSTTSTRVGTRASTRSETSSKSIRKSPSPTLKKSNSQSSTSIRKSTSMTKI